MGVDLYQDDCVDIHLPPRLARERKVEEEMREAEVEGREAVGASSVGRR